MVASKDDFLAQPAAGKAVAAPAEEQKAVPANPLAENVQIEVEEKISCLVNMDGEVEKFEIKGAIFMTLNDPKKNKAKVQVAFQPVKGFTFRPHIEVNRSNWNK